MALTKIPSSLLDTSSGFDLQGNITLGDSEKIRLGDGPDLDIYHDGSNSYIEDLGDGALFVKASGGIYFNGKTTDEPLARFLENGAVNLYYDNDLRIATSSAGATVDGTLTVTGNLDITGDINSYNVTDLDVTDQTITLGAGQTEANSGGSGIIIDGSSASILWDETNDEWDFNKKIHIGGETYFDAGTRHYTYDDQANFWSLYTNTDDTFRFNYNGSGDDEIVITTSGTVGISQGSPSSTYKLDVGGPIRSSGSAPSYTLREDDASSQTWLMGSYGGTFAVRDTTVSGTAYPFQIEAATPSNTLFLDSSGNVGIGTSSPDHDLHIESTDPTLILAQSGSLNNANSGRILFAESPSYTTVDAHFEIKYDGLENHLYFGSPLDQTTDLFVVGRDGNVGIGTDEPSSGMQIKGDGKSLKVSSADYDIGFLGALGSGGTSLDKGYFYLKNTGTTKIQLHSDGDSYFNGGNVGIGNTDPQVSLALGNASGERMHVYHGGNVRAGFGVDMSGASRELSIFHSHSTGTNGLISFGRRLESNGAYTETARIDGSGDIYSTGQVKQGNSDGTPRFLNIPYASAASGFTFDWQKLANHTNENDQASEQNAFMFEVNVTSYLGKYIKAIIVVDTNSTNSLSLTTLHNAGITMTASIPTGTELITLTFSGLWGNSTNFMGRITTF